MEYLLSLHRHPKMIDISFSDIINTLIKARAKKKRFKVDGHKVAVQGLSAMFERREIPSSRIPFQTIPAQRLFLKYPHSLR